MESLLIYLAIGLASGFTAGLFGVGGGMIIVPALLWVFSIQDFDASYTTHLAIGTSLAVIIVTSISSIRAHHLRHSVRWDLLRHMGIGLMIGALIGAAIADHLQAIQLQLGLGLFSWFVAYRMLHRAHIIPEVKVFSAWIYQSIATGIGAISAIVGIGGGSLTVPFLVRSGIPITQAVGTAAAAGFPIAIVGACGFIFFGVDNHQILPAHAIGFVYVPAALGIALMSIFSAQWGAKLAHQLPAARLQQFFAVLMMIIGTLFIYQFISHILIG